MLGSGTAGDPYIIQDVSDLQDISLDLAAYYELGNHIEAAGYDFTMLGTFTGSLDGIEFEVRDLTIVDVDGPQQGALISVNQGTVKNVHLRDCVINISHSGLAVLAGSLIYYNDVAGVIENCSATGTVTVDGVNAAMAGGLVVYNDGSISDSWTSVVTSATSTNVAAASGFCDENIGTIDDCYATGSATAFGVTAYANGFIEENYAPTGVITNSYSTGKPTAASAVSGFCRVNGQTITACFWDIETSETAVSDGGTGKTTSQMKQKGTFSEWDIGYSPHYLNDGYPFLSWEIGISSTWLIYGLVGNGDEDGDEEPEPEPEPEPTPGVVKPSVMTLPATGISQ